MRSSTVELKKVMGLATHLRDCIIAMEQRLNIDAITPHVKEWTSKVLVVDKYPPRKSKNQNVHFQTDCTG
ncbi:hypothetical protein H5410_061189 [Solanum commersonii]|uniref:Uncharacterized protein n=1 Tax=Solanum commersonii TaxID=4109 RepID=A0A9J5W7W5_SOLCO|nr:hypothetical protein H5410_061189 [Solanum commersonii]